MIKILGLLCLFGTRWLVLLCIPPNIDLGDTNLDGDINVADIVVLVNFILEVESYNDIEFQASDLNNDNTLTVQDIIVLVNLILGI